MLNRTCRKVVTALAFLVCGIFVAGQSHAGNIEHGELFTFENKHSSFTLEVDTAKLSRFSVQVTYSTETISAVTIKSAGVSLADNVVTVSTNNFGQGMPALLTGTAPPGPLTANTTYFMVKVSDTLLAFATTYAQAVSRDTINLLTNTGGSWTVTPLALSLGSAGYVWTASNDGDNWVTVGSSQALTALSATPASRLHDWGEYAYRFLRFTFSGPASGAIKLRAYLSGRKD